MRDGRPLRFLAVAIGGWAALRASALWTLAERALPDIVHRIVAPTVAAAALAPPSSEPVRSPTARRSTAIVRTIIPTTHLTTMAPAAATVSATPPAAAPPPRHTADLPQIAVWPPLGPARLATGPRRFAGSAWLLARGGPSGTLSGGQLGASQAGIRVTYGLGHARRLAIAARFATPLAGPGKEAAIGIDWQPTRLPFHLVAEQRFVLDGGRGGPTIGLIGGFGPGEIAHGIRLEAYGQAGAIARNGIEGFVDAAARVTHRIVDKRPVRVDIGAGAWGSAQPGAARFDIGPTIGITIPVAQRAIRLAIDWRERVAGHARPGSGPAVTLGGDF